MASLASGRCAGRTTALTSLNKQYQLWMQDGGNLVLYRDSDGKAVWATDTEE